MQKVRYTYSHSAEVSRCTTMNTVDRSRYTDSHTVVVSRSTTMNTVDRYRYTAQHPVEVSRCTTMNTVDGQVQVYRQSHCGGIQVYNYEHRRQIQALDRSRYTARHTVEVSKCMNTVNRSRYIGTMWRYPGIQLRTLWRYPGVQL